MNFWMRRKIFSGNELTGTAPHVMNLLFFFKSQGLYGNVNYRFVDAMPLRDDNSVYSDAFQVLNLKVGYQRSIGNNWKVDLNGGLNNIFDEHYASMHQINAGSFGGAAPRYYYPGLPRHFYTGLTLKYIFTNSPKK